ncbi:MAG: hypothetical protein ACI8V4_003177, partial [Ilumatobacter sp.]
AMVSVIAEPDIETPAEPPLGLPVGANTEGVGESFDEGHGCVKDDVDDVGRHRLMCCRQRKRPTSAPDR